MSDEMIQEMISLAARLRQSTGQELDDEAIAAVAEATGAPQDYVRLAIRAAPQQRRRQSAVDQLRNSFLAFDPDKRRYVMGSVLGLGAGFFLFLNQVMPNGDRSGFLMIMAMLATLGAAWNSAVSRKPLTGAISGALFAGTSQLFLAFLGFIVGLLPRWIPMGTVGSSSVELLGYGFLGLFVGGLVCGLFESNRKRLGFRDPNEERYQLLQQLLEIQNRLKSDEREVTFLSVDIVGSTRMKADNDPLAVEYTFTEYHRYIEQIVHKFGGRIHSTAGDGVTAVFDDPALAVRAGKATLAGLFEFNMARNKTSRDIVLRAGLHSGHVQAPGGDATDVDFALVIDLAAHMQKAAPAGSLAVSQATLARVPGHGLNGESVAVDEHAALIWTPRARPLAAALVEPGT